MRNIQARPCSKQMPVNKRKLLIRKNESFIFIMNALLWSIFFDSALNSNHVCIQEEREILPFLRVTVRPFDFKPNERASWINRHTHTFDGEPTVASSGDFGTS